MSESVERDPGSELGLKNPVRDKERLGEEQYSVTPPRSVVRAPNEEHAPAACAACQSELDPVRSYRVDAEEYAYHFCGAECFEKWRKSNPQRASQARLLHGRET